MNFCRRARSHLRAHRCLYGLLAAMLLQGLHSNSAVAQTTCTRAGAIGDPNAQPCLFTLTTAPGPYAYNALEIAAARADDAAYANLLPVCGAGAAAGGCTGARLNLFTRLRELEDNAAQLLGIGFGPTNYSLNLSRQGVGFALRWTADEEFSAQSSMTNRFANNQLGAISNRLTALRFLQTVRLARQDSSGVDESLADAAYGGAGVMGGTALTGGAGGDPSSATFGRWSVFANGAYGAGTKAPTTFDDAFSFGGTQFSGGADVRLSPHLVVGVLVDHVRQEADFNPSLSIAAGGIWASGFGVASYVQMDWDAAYLNASLGVQRLSINTTRLVAYPSNNPQIQSVDTTFLQQHRRHLAAVQRRRRLHPARSRLLRGTLFERPVRAHSYRRIRGIGERPRSRVCSERAGPERHVADRRGRVEISVCVPATIRRRSAVRLRRISPRVPRPRPRTSRRSSRPRRRGTIISSCRRTRSAPAITRSARDSRLFCRTERSSMRST